ncbi:hypothetical protein [Allobaculum mucilyticum]|uniref:hypothetical protein n=2 Tax=Allobaculum mucilyticum TaxID=2834459 RepID=UPI001E2982BE|nr:hypothetical protein [Allobaculum mucilyticum]
MVRILNRKLSASVLAANLIVLPVQTMKIAASEEQTPFISMDDSEDRYVRTGDSRKPVYQPVMYNGVELEPEVTQWFGLNASSAPISVNPDGTLHFSKAGVYTIGYEYGYSDESLARYHKQYPEDEILFPAIGRTVTFYVSDTPFVFRLFNPNTGEHFYTCSSNERNALIKAGWRAEHFNWLAEEETAVPVYRLYDPNAGDHLFTLDQNEYEQLGKIGWTKEGVAWQSSKENQRPVYRLYNPNAKTGRHHMTSSKKEADYLVSAGWKNEGIAWYGANGENSLYDEADHPAS